MSWLDQAVCSKDKHSDYWLSYNLEKIEYAKLGCENCSVQMQCISNAMSGEDEPVGVIAGLSEFERKIMKWKEATDIDGSNW